MADREVLEQIVDEDDDVDLDDDLEPTGEFLDPRTQRVLDEADKLLAEFEQSLSSLSAEDEFDTALIVDNAEEVERLLKTSQELQRLFPWQRLLSIAIEHGKCPRVLKLCIDRGAQVNQSVGDRDQEVSPLVSCIRHRALPHMWQVLLDNGADTELGDAEMTPVQHAILFNKTDMLWALKAAGTDMNAEDPHGRGTPLRFAISMRCVDAALELLQMDVDPDAPLGGQTLLHSLCLPPPFARDADLMRALASRGANLEARDKQGRTPFLLAIHHNRLALASLLAELGADVQAVDERGQNALLIQVKSALALPNLELSDFLLVRGVSATQLPVRGIWSAATWTEKIIRDRIGDITPHLELAALLQRYGVTLNLGSEFPTTQTGSMWP